MQTLTLPDPIDLGAARRLGDDLCTMHTGVIDLAKARRAGRIITELVARLQVLELRNLDRPVEAAQP